MTVAADECRLDESERAAFQRWLDRPPPRRREGGPSWRDWFDADGEYLGERSGRAGPDDVGASQPCRCEVCQSADVAPGRTNEGEAWVR